jgi:hypothetical protein
VIVSLDGDIRVMFCSFSVEVVWKVEIVFFFSCVYLPVFGRLECFGPVFLPLLLLGRM